MSAPSPNYRLERTFQPRGNAVRKRYLVPARLECRSTWRWATRGNVFEWCTTMLSWLFGISMDNQDEWVRTEDPACYLHVYEDKRLIEPDTTTRTRYCEVP